MKYIIEDYRVYLENSDGNILAYVTFPLIDDDVVMINHTYVDNSLRGQGVASVLLEKAYNKIKEQNYKVIPTCSYALNWFNKHENRQDILKN